MTLLGFVSHLGPIANWGLEFANKRQIRSTRACETNLPGVYAAGDVAGFDGKITLITVGFSEAALAANHAVAAHPRREGPAQVLNGVRARAHEHTVCGSPP